MISFQDGDPKAIIKGGKYNNQIIYLQPDKQKNNGIELEDPIDHLQNKFLSDPKNKKKRNELYKIDKIKQGIKGAELLDDEELIKIYQDAQAEVNKNSKNEIELHDGEIIPIPDISKEREVIYITAPSGAGKSTWISKYTEQYKKLYPKRKIYVFSRLRDDKCIDKLKPIRIMINEELIDDPIDPEELKNSLVIFDDTDTIPNKEMRDAVNNIKDDILETGRHHNITCLVSSHLASNYKETRRILNESHSIVIFCKGGSFHSIKYVLSKYVGLSKDDIDKIRKLPSRWVLIYKHYPQYVIYQNGMYLLGQDEE